MGEIWFRLILGHLVGDYLFQNNWMALNKKKKGNAGFAACGVHCLVYTLAVCSCMYPELKSWTLFESAFFVLSVWFSHYILDRTYVIEAWLKLIKSRTYEGCLELKKYKEVYKDMPSLLSATHEYSPAQLFGYIYTCIVNTMADNTMHLLMMYGIIKFLMR